MTETRLIQVVGVALAAALTILSAQALPIYIVGLSVGQVWFAATLLGISIAGLAVEFLPPLLGEEGTMVTMPPLPWQRGQDAEPEAAQLRPRRPVRRSGGSAADEVAAYAETVREALTRGWQRAMVKHGERAAICIEHYIAGPLTVSVGLRIRQPSAQLLADAQKQLPIQLQTLLGVAGRTQRKGRGRKVDLPIAVSYGGGMLWVDLPSPRPQVVDGLKLAQHSSAGVPLHQRTHGDRTDITPCVAINSMREPVYLDMANNPCVIWVGPTQRGKTSGLTSALYAICRRNGPDRFRFIVATKKISDWRVWADTPHCVGIFTDASQAAAVLTDIAGAELVNRSAEVFGDYPTLLVIADDLKNLLAQDKSIAVPLKEIASAGGECRVYLWASTQGAGSNEDSAGLDNNATFRVVYKPTSDTSAYQAAGLSGLNVTGLSDAKGDVYVIDNGNIERAATGLTSPKLVRKLSQVEGGGDTWSTANITLPPMQWGYSTESGDSSGDSYPHLSPLESPPMDVGKRDVSDAECLSIWHAMKDNGGDYGVNDMCRRLFGEKGVGGPNKRKLQGFLDRGEALATGNNEDIFDQLSDIDTTVLGGDD